MWWASGLHENSPVAPSTWIFALPLYPELGTIHGFSKALPNSNHFTPPKCNQMRPSWSGHSWDSAIKLNFSTTAQKLHVIVLLMGVIVFWGLKDHFIEHSRLLYATNIFGPHAFKISLLDIKLSVLNMTLIIQITRFVFMLFWRKIFKI